jgi:molybdopterin synthase sulfur carrier subunit
MEWRLFADLAERADARRVPVDPGQGATIEDALSELFAVHPELESRVLEDGEVADHLTILIDGEPVGDLGLDEPVSETAELALFPPVSGG